MSKSDKTEAPKVSKGSNVKHFTIAMVVIVVLASMSYTAFITVVGVGGRTNLYLAAPSIVTVFAILIFAVYKAVNNK